LIIDAHISLVFHSFTTKVDYGAPYEQIRVKEGYSRLHGVELKDAQDTLNDQDEDMLRNFFTYSANDINEALLFFDDVLLKPSWPTTETYRRRALLAALALYGRVREIQEEFKGVDLQDLGSMCDNGASSAENLEGRLMTIIHQIVREIRSKRSKSLLRTEILKFALLQEVFYKHTSVSVASMSEDELYKALCNPP